MVARAPSEDPLEADREVEREANIFASELLMPEAAVQANWKDIDTESQEDSTALMATLLDVSPSAMGWRLFNLGLVEEKPT